MATRKPTDLLAFKPKYQGQSLSDYMAGRDAPTTSTVQAPDAQGRLRRFDSPADVAAHHTAARDSYAAASEARSNGISFKREAPGYATGGLPPSGATPSQNIPTGVLEAAMTGNDPQRLAQWSNSTQGQESGGLTSLMEKFDPRAKASREALDMRSAAQQQATAKDRSTVSGYLAAIDPEKYSKDNLASMSLADLAGAKEFEITNQAQQQQLAQQQAAQQQATQEANFDSFMSGLNQFDQALSGGGDVSAVQFAPGHTADTYQGLLDNPAYSKILELNRAGIDTNTSDLRKYMDEGFTARDAASGGANAPVPNAREREIDDVMQSHGLPRTEAMGLVDGTTRLVTDPVSGTTSIVDMVTGKGRKVEIPDAMRQDIENAANAPDQGADQSDINLYEMAQSTTGLMPTLLANAQKITGQIGIDTAPPELIENIQTFKAAQNEIIRALSINPRFPVAEINRIKEEINIAPGALKDAKTLQAQLRSVDGYLRQRLKQEQSSAADTNLPTADRRDALSAAKNIGSFLKIVGVPQEDKQAPTKPKPSALDQDVEDLVNKWTKDAQ